MEERDAERLARIAIETAKRLLNGADAEDAAQEALARVLAVGPDALRDADRYLRVVVRNLARRTRRLARTSPEPLGDRDPTDLGQSGDRGDPPDSGLDGIPMPERARRLGYSILRGVRGTRAHARALGWQPQEVRRARHHLLAAILVSDVPVKDSKWMQALAPVVFDRGRPCPPPPREEESPP